MEQPIGQFELLPIAISILLLLPYFAWGFYTLRTRYIVHEELAPALEIFTLAGVAIFYFLELRLLNAGWANDRLLVTMSIVGLFASGLALYGHMVTNLVSQLLIGSIMPHQKFDPQTPRFGSAEALEEVGDYEGAVNEYMAIARMFPKDSIAPLRLGDNLLRLKRSREAVVWFEKGLTGLLTAEQSLPILYRLCEVYQRHLESPRDVERVLVEYIARFPDTEHASKAQVRLDRLRVSQASAGVEASATPRSSNLLTAEEAGVGLEASDELEEDAPRGKELGGIIRGPEEVMG